ncbi:hypothetical protein AYI68_g5378 [Smittium mucronatum]|uniref:Uncharacterized protein n=1 Tax=Smittium mucronatum TaxID=133383 RepID=A0A1R0GUG4_9FUNG|nr:hypothetical protein AYI68_g5378 [Smittium mucronatum]
MDSFDPSKNVYNWDDFSLPENSEISSFNSKSQNKDSSIQMDDPSSMPSVDINSLFNSISTDNVSENENHNNQNSIFQNNPNFYNDPNSILDLSQDFLNIDPSDQEKLLNIDFSKILQDMNFDFSTINNSKSMDEISDFVFPSIEDANNVSFFNQPPFDQSIKPIVENIPIISTDFDQNMDVDQSTSLTNNEIDSSKSDKNTLSPNNQSLILDQKSLKPDSGNEISFVESQPISNNFSKDPIVIDDGLDFVNPIPESKSLSPTKITIKEPELNDDVVLIEKINHDIKDPSFSKSIANNTMQISMGNNNLYKSVSDQLPENVPEFQKIQTSASDSSPKFDSQLEDFKTGFDDKITKVLGDKTDEKVGSEFNDDFELSKKSEVQLGKNLDESLGNYEEIPKATKADDLEASSTILTPTPLSLPKSTNSPILTNSNQNDPIVLSDSSEKSSVPQNIQNHLLSSQQLSRVSSLPNPSNPFNFDTRPVLSLNSSPSIFNSNLSNKVVIVHNSSHKTPKIHIEINPNSYQSSNIDSEPSSYQSFNIEFRPSDEVKPEINLKPNFTNGNINISSSTENRPEKIKPVEDSKIKFDQTISNKKLSTPSNQAVSTSNPTPIIIDESILLSPSAKKRKLSSDSDPKKNLGSDLDHNILAHSGPLFQKGISQMNLKISPKIDDISFKKIVPASGESISSSINPYYQIDSFEKYCMILGNFLSTGPSSLKSQRGIFNSLKKGTSPICIQWSRNNLVAISWPQSISTSSRFTRRLDPRDVKKQTSSLLTDASLGNKNDYRTPGSPVQLFQLISFPDNEKRSKRGVGLMRIGQLSINHNGFKLPKNNRLGLGGKSQSSETGVSNVWWNDHGNRVIIAEPSGRVAVFNYNVQTSAWDQVKIVDYICPISSAVWFPDSREYLAFVGNSELENNLDIKTFDDSFNIKLGPCIRNASKESYNNYVILTCAGRFELSQKINRSGQRRYIDLSPPEDFFDELGIWTISHSDISILEGFNIIVVVKWMYIPNPDSTKVPNYKAPCIRVYEINTFQALIANSDLVLVNQFGYELKDNRSMNRFCTTFLKLVPSMTSFVSKSGDRVTRHFPLLVIIGSFKGDYGYETLVETFDLSEGIEKRISKIIPGLATGIQSNKPNIVSNHHVDSVLGLKKYFPWFIGFSNGRIVQLFNPNKINEELQEFEISPGSLTDSMTFSCVSHNLSGVLKVTQKAIKVLSQIELKKGIVEILDIEIDHQKEIQNFTRFGIMIKKDYYVSINICLRVVNNYDLKDLLLSFNSFNQEEQRYILLNASRLVCLTLGTSDIILDPRYSDSMKFIKLLGFSATNIINIENTILQSNLMIFLNFANISKIFLSFFGSNVYENLSQFRPESSAISTDLGLSSKKWSLFISPHLEKLDSITSWVLETSILLIRDIVLYFKQATPNKLLNQYTDFYWAYSRLAIVAYPQILDCIINSLSVIELMLFDSSISSLEKIQLSSLPKFSKISQSSPLPFKKIISIFKDFRQMSIESKDHSLFYEMLFCDVEFLNLPPGFSKRIQSVLDSVFLSSNYHIFDDFITFSQSTPVLLNPLGDLMCYQFKGILFSYISPQDSVPALEESDGDSPQSKFKPQTPLDSSDISSLINDTDTSNYNLNKYDYSTEPEKIDMTIDDSFLLFFDNSKNSGSMRRLDLGNMDSVKEPPKEVKTIEQDLSSHGFNIPVYHTLDKEKHFFNGSNVGYLVSNLQLMNIPSGYESFSENRIPLLNNAFDVIYKTNLNENVSMVNNSNKELLIRTSLKSRSNPPLDDQELYSVTNSKLLMIDLSNPNSYLKVCSNCGNFTTNLSERNDCSSLLEKEKAGEHIGGAFPRNLINSGNGHTDADSNRDGNYLNRFSFFNFDNFCICGGQWIFV